MSPTPFPSATLVCEILAAEPEMAAVLAEIAALCARDVGQPLVFKSRTTHGAENVITLHLPADLAASQHPVWCLACRLACFCPAARVSVVVEAAPVFRAVRRRRRNPAAAA